MRSSVKKKLIISGNPVDGFDYYGPFDDINDSVIKDLESYGIESDWWTADVVGIGNNNDNQSEFITMAAFSVYGNSQEDSQAKLIESLKLLNQMPHVDCWWIAEDERQDRSDNNSAVFVPYGMTQEEAEDILREAQRLKYQSQVKKMSEIGDNNE